MATGELGTVLLHLRKLVAAQATKDLTDGQLLGSFTARHDQAAFTSLVQRHGGLVLSVCRRVLHHEQDAEDAFQATFLVLARSAATIRKADAVADWLHGVAYRSAMQIKRAGARRRSHEKQAKSMSQPKPDYETAWRELQAVLDDEVQRLPEKYRLPFVCCCLEGKSKGPPSSSAGKRARCPAGWRRPANNCSNG